MEPLDGDEPPDVDPFSGQRRSSVLVLADPAAPGLPLLFIRRSHLVSSHRGQIAFPGGGVDAVDGGVADTALREAREELGVDPAAVELIGRLPPMLTATSGRRLDPVVGLATSPIEVRPDAYEVADWFWVPLSDLLAAPVTTRAVPGGEPLREVHFIEVGDRVIWGATGAVVVDLLGRMRAALGVGPGGGDGGGAPGASRPVAPA